MKHIHKMTFLLFVVALTFSSAYAAPQSATIELVVGMRLERTLTSGDKHVYTVKLDNGAAIIADEVVPWARSNYSIHPGPSNVFVAGASRGGFAATNISFTHPETVGNVLSQSGSYWITKKIMQYELEKASFYPNQYVYPRETGMMIETFKNSKRLPIRFYMDIGIYEDGAAMLGTNRQLRDVLQLKGYDVDYREFYADHGFQSWRSRLSVGLISLLGRKVP